MSTENTILVATVEHPERRFRIGKTQFDKANEVAKEAGNESPFIVQEEGCEGGPAYDDLTKAEQVGVKKVQVKRQKVIDDKLAAKEE